MTKNVRTLNEKTFLWKRVLPVMQKILEKKGSCTKDDLVKYFPRNAQGLGAAMNAAASPRRLDCKIKVIKNNAGMPINLYLSKEYQTTKMSQQRKKGYATKLMRSKQNGWLQLSPLTSKTIVKYCNLDKSALGAANNILAELVKQRILTKDTSKRPYVYYRNMEFRKTNSVEDSALQKKDIKILELLSIINNQNQDKPSFFTRFKHLIMGV